MKQVFLTIKGRVQGVLFRDFIKDIADMLRIRGYVKNTPEGNVEVLAQGPEKILNELIKFCWSGPSGAIVEKVETKEQKPKEKFKEFEIKY